MIARIETSTCVRGYHLYRLTLNSWIPGRVFVYPRDNQECE
jgi:hypothetical protein